MINSADKSIMETLDEMREKTQDKMSETFPYDIPDVDEKKNQLMKVRF